MDNKNCTKSYLRSFLWLCFLTLAYSCDKRTAENPSLYEIESSFDERLSSLSSDGDSAVWIGSETGDIWHSSRNRLQHYNIGTDRIYKVVADRRASDTPHCWIGTRNSGLQLWKIDGQEMHHIATYTIPHKQEKYSVYDIVVQDSTIYAATSQGLFVLVRNQKSQQVELKQLYPSMETETAKQAKPFLVIRLCLLADKSLLAATNKGLLLLDNKTSNIQIKHQNEQIYDVSVSDNYIYILGEKRLYIHNINTKRQQTIDLPQAAYSYYHIGKTHYFVNSNDIFLSRDLKNFFTLSLKRKIPVMGHNLIGFDRQYNSIMFITENALCRIPYHLSIFNDTNAITAATSNNTHLYILNSNGELFSLAQNDSIAVKIYKFPANEDIRQLMLSGNHLYYITNSNELRQISLTGNYLLNELKARSRILYQSPTKITAAWIQKSDQKGEQIYLGIQDELVIVDHEGKTETVSQLSGRYITSFFSNQESKELYLSTLNGGCFYGNTSRFRHINQTEHYQFIRDLAVTEGYDPQLFLLTNRHLIRTNNQDTVTAKGHQKIIAASDSLLFTLPELGIHRWSAEEGHLKSDGTFYQDIHFKPQASLFANKKLYLGSDIGMLKLNSDKQMNPQWIGFRNHVLTINLLLSLLGTIVSIMLIGFLFYKKYTFNKNKLIHQHLAELLSQGQELLSMTKMADISQVKVVEQLINKIQNVKANNPTDYLSINHLSDEIMRKNRDMALMLSKHLDEQIEKIKQIDAYDSNQRIKDSQSVRQSENIEKIYLQAKNNELWLNQIQDIKSDLVHYQETIRDIDAIKGVNTDFIDSIKLLENEIYRRPVEELSDLLKDIKKQEIALQTPERLSMLLQHIAIRRHSLTKITPTSPVSYALLNDIDSLTNSLKREYQNLHLRCWTIIDIRIGQLEALQEIRQLINEYSAIRKRIVNENENRIMKKFDAKLELEISSHTHTITERIGNLIDQLHKSFLRTDAKIFTDVLKLTSTENQSSRVLILLMAAPKVRRIIVPGLLGMFGNFNPVISRLMNNRIKPNDEILRNYVKKNPTSAIYFIEKLTNM